MSETPFTLLVVDDNEINRMTWVAHLKRQGYIVETAEDGLEAIQQVEKKPIDLILLDIMMPVMSGFEVLKILRQTYSPADLPIIMATARDQSEDIVEAFELGANDYVTKPVDFPVSLVRIQAQLRSRTPSRTRMKAPTLSAKTIAEAEPGTILEDKYRLEELIGHGTYGAVYRATHLKLKRAVAVKLLHAHVQKRGEALKRFEREGISACQIEHPNAVAVLDFNVAFGVPFLVMEMLEGHSLEEEMKRTGTMSPLRCAVVLLPICEVLAEAHSLGIIHRDIKPQNIFLQHARRGEVVKVLDFGIAKLIDNPNSDADITIEGGGPGTPTYMAPERFSKNPYDGSADVYSLGIMLYEMLCAHPPFISPDGNPIRVALMHMSEPPKSLCERNPEIPRPVEEVVMRALEKDPRKRPTAGELARQFFAALGLQLPTAYENALRRAAPAPSNLDSSGVRMGGETDDSSTLS